MYTIEMFVADGYWSVTRYGNRKQPSPFNRTQYEHKPSSRGRWVPVGGKYATEAEAEEKITQYALTGSYAKPKAFRVRWPP
jgi:hypothetical protein